MMGLNYHLKMLFSCQTTKGIYRQFAASLLRFFIFGIYYTLACVNVIWHLHNIHITLNEYLNLAELAKHIPISKTTCDDDPSRSASCRVHGW